MLIWVFKERLFYWHSTNCWKQPTIKIYPNNSSVTLSFVESTPPHPTFQKQKISQPSTLPSLVISSLINRKQECCLDIIFQGALLSCIYCCFQYMNWNCVLLITWNICCMNKQKNKKYMYNVTGNGLCINSHWNDALESLIIPDYSSNRFLLSHCPSFLAIITFLHFRPFDRLIETIHKYPKALLMRFPIISEQLGKLVWHELFCFW